MGFRLRSLMNVRAPMAADETFLAVQDDYLRRELDARGVVRLSDLRPLCGDLYLWQGDITRLQCGAIVNAANAGITAATSPVTPALTTASTPTQVCSCGATARRSWRRRAAPSRPGGRRSRGRITSPVTMFSTPSARS